ncbi:methyltransferase domain-containing protein, partial [Streptococcus pneumoniae]|nr:methyltransferase domain-containing protein [Streptococcus pneumoniae]
DLCAGNGAIPLFLSARTESTITGVELQPRLAGMARRSIEFNGLSGQIDIIEGDVKEIPAQLGYEKYDTVTCNPPYFPAHDMSDKNLSEHMA